MKCQRFLIEFLLYIKVFSGRGDRWLGQWDACILHPQFRCVWCFICLGVLFKYELYLWLVMIIFIGIWNLQSQEVLSLGTPPLQPIRCCLAKEGCLWVGYWNKVYMISVKNRKVEVGFGWKWSRSLFIIVHSDSFTYTYSFCPFRNRSQCLSEVSSRCVFCAQQEVESGLPADWIPFLGFLIGQLAARYRK